MKVPAIVGQAGRLLTSPTAMKAYGTTAKVAGLGVTFFIGAIHGTRSRPTDNSSRTVGRATQSTSLSRILGVIAALAAYRISGSKGVAATAIAFTVGHLITVSGKSA